MTTHKLGIIGLGGFAQAHHRAALALETEGRCELVCTCDPKPDQFTDFAEEMKFSQRCVAVYDDYRTMFAEHGDDLDVVGIPTPVPLHAPMHKLAVDAGVAVYLEKPPTLNHLELDRMLATEQRAVKDTNVGFNFIVEPARRQLKQRLVDGEFGDLKNLALYTVWPRPPSYFERAGWAGRLMLDNKLVLDSCMGNACSHYLHNMLFWAGAELDDWGSPKNVAAELYRFHNIQSFDTVFARAELDTGVPLQVAMTHGIVPNPAFPAKHQERMECEKATLIYHTHNQWQVLWHDGRREVGRDGMTANPTVNFAAYFDYLDGTAERSVTRLADCKPFVQFYNLVYLAAGKIVTVGDQSAVDDGWPSGDGLVSFEEVRQTVEHFHQTGEWPSRRSLGWAEPGGGATLEQLPELDEMIKRLAAESK